MFSLFTALIVIANSAAIDETRALMEEWDKFMRGFHPDDLISFSIGVGQEEVFIEKITQPTTIRGTFFIPVYTTDTIDFKVYDPSGTMIYAKMMKKEAVFSVNCTQLGDYQLTFTNKRAKEPKVVQLAIDVSRSEKEELSQEDIDPIEQDVAEFSKRLVSVFYSTKLGELKSKGAFQEIQKLNQKLMILTIIETIGICGVTIWQVWYIKKLLNDRRLV